MCGPSSAGPQARDYRACRRAGRRFESGELADFIVHGAAGQAGALPLLAFYMTDLWERMQKRGDGVLAAHRQGRDGGRRQGAHRPGRPLPRRASGRYRCGEAPVHAQARPRAGEGKAVRRRVARTRLDAAEWRLVEALSEPRWRLVTTGEDSEGAYAEVAHEALLQSWATLVAWLEGEREFLSFKAHVEQAEAAWIRPSGTSAHCCRASI